MSGGIFAIQDNGDLVEMKEQGYDSEYLLQELLTKYPNLLAGDQINSTVSRRWLLISREMPLASEEDGGNRWSVDHLFLDQDAIPTLVEVKRSCDTRIRREVVGQMLDYAANGVVYWPIEKLIAQFETNCKAQGASPQDVLSDFLGPESDPEQFWNQVQTNLKIGKIRMVFAADLIPPELQRVVEFLNNQMTPAEVLAVEIRQFVGQGLKTMVPRVIGLTSEATQKKGNISVRKWDEQSFFEALKLTSGEAGVAAGRKIFDWAQNSDLKIL
jgi:hypothetical protein